MPRDGAPTHRLPHALEHLRDLARRLVAADPGPHGQLRVWVTVPISTLAAGAAIQGALDGEALCEGCFHADLRAGDRVAAYAQRKFQDTRLNAVSSEWLKFAGSTIPRSTATVYRLPESFPDNRHAMEVSDEIRSLLAGAYHCAADLAGHRHVRASGHPVIVVGSREAVQTDVDTWADLSRDEAFAGRARASDLDDWYRSPVLTAGSMPRQERKPWLAQVRPRLVVTTTTTAALATSPWPEVPVLALLSRRSPSAVGAADLAHQLRTTPAVLDGRLGLALRPGHGLEIAAAYVPADAVSPVDEAGDGEEQW